MASSREIVALCSECGLPTVSHDAMGGLCPGCLIATTLENLSTVDHPALGRFGAIGAAPDVAWLTGRLPQFEFLELLGRGGAGWVFLARQRSLDRLVAIKLLDGRSIGREDAAKRFEREAQILARLKHPRIVTVHDFGTVEDCPFLVMEYVAGPTLREVLRRQPLAYDDCLRIMRQICEAVRYAHEMGVLHRDLKPENVIFESYENIDSLRVADFGISRLIGDTEPGFHLTQTGFVVGTPFYAAPEQMSSETGVDQRTDLFSIGVMFYEMLSGELPRGCFPAPSTFGRAPQSIDAVVLRCLESDPAKRYPNVEALNTALDGSARGKRAQRTTTIELILAAILCAACVGAFLASSVGFGLQGGESAEASANLQSANPSSQTVTSTRREVATRSESHSSTTVRAGEQSQAAEPADTSQASQPAFTISNVTIRGDHPRPVTLRMDCRLTIPEFALAGGSTLRWVVRTADGRRIDSMMPLAANRPDFTVEDQVFLRITDRWPIEVCLEEQWFGPSRGGRRVSNVVRVEKPAYSGFGIDPTIYRAVPNLGRSGDF